jgi:hypothetical protein
MVISVYGRVTRRLQGLVKVFSAVANASEVIGIVRELRKNHDHVAVLVSNSMP